MHCGTASTQRTQCAPRIFGSYREGSTNVQLLTSELRAKLPKLRATEKLGDDAPVVVKFFTPRSNWTWYATEFDGKDTFFGLVEGFEVEMGYFSLSELESLGPAIERDLYFGSHTLADVKARIARDY